MDEACIECDLDLSNRPYLYYHLNVTGKVGMFDTELVEEFFRALALNARISMHIIECRGKNKHHIIEAAFKSVAVAIRRATTKNENIGIPSTKDVL
jgi:imidazoleglycerol-phosphate dehydratase